MKGMTCVHGKRIPHAHAGGVCLLPRGKQRRATYDRIVETIREGFRQISPLDARTLARQVYRDQIQQFRVDGGGSLGRLAGELRALADEVEAFAAHDKAMSELDKR